MIPNILIKKLIEILIAQLVPLLVEELTKKGKEPEDKKPKG